MLRENTRAPPPFFSLRLSYCTELRQKNSSKGSSSCLFTLNHDISRGNSQRGGLKKHATKLRRDWVMTVAVLEDVQGGSGRTAQSLCVFLLFLCQVYLLPRRKIAEEKLCCLYWRGRARETELAFNPSLCPNKLQW